MKSYLTAGAAAATLGLCSFAYAGGPSAPSVDIPTTDSGIIQVHNTCHSQLRTHGGAYAQHYHDPGTCAMVLGQGGGGYDCHADVQKHFVQGHGSIWHSHNSNCNLNVYPSQGGPAPGIGGCIQVGPSTICGFGGGQY
jgi:hypothetical protein